MNGGLIAFIIGALTVVGAWLFGRSSGKAKGKEKANEAVSEARSETAKAEFAQTQAEKKADILGEVVSVATQAASAQATAQAEYNNTIRSINEAKRTNDMDSMMRIASEMARKALEKGVGEAR